MKWSPGDGIRNKAKAITEIPRQVMTLTILVIAGLILSAMAMLTAISAVHHAN